MYDQLGGGFHRYSVDAKWIVPHFEKMSYDNSELLKAYLDALRRRSAPRSTPTWRAASCAGCARWRPTRRRATRRARTPTSGLEDDGDYFTWTRDEAAAVLSGDELDVAAAYYDIGTAGEMHHNPGKNVLFVAASRCRRSPGSPGSTEDAARLLLARRGESCWRPARHRPAPVRRPHPVHQLERDDGLGDAARRARCSTTRRPAPTRSPRSTLLRRRERRSRMPLAHTPGGVTGLLDDQVQAAAAALDAYEATGDRDWLAWAERLMERVWRDYWDDAAGGLFDTARGPGRRGGPAARAGEAGAGHAHALARTGSRASPSCGCTS